MAPSPKLLQLPDRGFLLVAADLHGNLRDFLTVVAAFERIRQERGPDTFLLFLGDLIHGPYLPFSLWKNGGETTTSSGSGSGGGIPPYMHGRPYRDESPAILLQLAELQARYPERVYMLLGNHEHAHIGGPRTSLFARDEATALEQRLGAEACAWLNGFLRGLPLWALSASGLLFSHAAPAARLGRLDDLEAIDYRRYAPPRLARHDASPETAARLLGQLLWTPALSPEQAHEVLCHLGATMAIYGHAIIPGGFQTIGSDQLILSSSFGMEDADKRMLFLDLNARYRSALDLRPGTEILPLYPQCASLALASPRPSR